MMAGLRVIHTHTIDQNQRLLITCPTDTKIDLRTTATLAYIQTTNPFQRIGQITDRQYL